MMHDDPIETDVRPLGEILTDATERATEAFGDNVCGATITDARDVLTVAEAYRYDDIRRWIGVPLGQYVYERGEFVTDDDIDVVREWARDYTGDYAD